MQCHRKGTGVATGCSYALMSDFKMLCCHVSLVPRLEPETTGHVNKAKLQQSLLMDVDLPLGTEQALMLHSVYIIPCISRGNRTPGSRCNAGCDSP